MAERRMLPPIDTDIPDRPPQPPRPPIPPRDPDLPPRPPRPKPPPMVVYWSRIEPLPYELDLQPGLAGPARRPAVADRPPVAVRGARGRGRGSPVELKIDGETAPLTRFAAGALNPAVAPKPVDFRGLGLPLEPAVEREAARPHDRLTAEAGLHFLRLLAREGMSAHAPPTSPATRWSPAHRGRPIRWGRSGCVCTRAARPTAPASPPT